MKNKPRVLLVGSKRAIDWDGTKEELLDLCIDAASQYMVAGGYNDLANHHKKFADCTPKEIAERNHDYESIRKHYLSNKDTLSMHLFTHPKEIDDFIATVLRYCQFAIIPFPNGFDFEEMPEINRIHRYRKRIGLSYS